MPDKSTKSDEAYLFDMLESATLIRDYMSGVTQDSFRDDIQKRDAVALRLSIIGEAASHLSKAPEGVPLKALRGLRNRIAHAYGLVDWQVIWQITQTDIPPLIKALKAHLPSSTN